eukprot:TRINITY_DN33857_c0_g1_i1.p1 TRINITY_DN33857_c0_g1~~TRINITY_DN33857_c0_g1_i1.p1  ORF type:complete len:925 (-),score=174.12 TRINITY_DN33857_c0_g1_i1:38-2812(-)
MAGRLAGLAAATFPPGPREHQSRRELRKPGLPKLVKPEGMLTVSAQLSLEHGDTVRPSSTSASSRPSFQGGGSPGRPRKRPSRGRLSAMSDQQPAVGVPQSMLSKSSPSSTPALGSVRPLLWAHQRSFDRQLSGEFEMERERQTQHPLRPASPIGGESLDIGVSEEAAWENFKKERYRVEIERGADLAATAGRQKNDRGDDLAVSADVEVLAAMTPEAFAEDLKAVNELIEDCSKAIRFEHLDDNSQNEQRRKAEREAERRRLEEAQRRARKREQEARDPHRKIALRLENKRRFEMDAVEKGMGIPMQNIDFHGGSGTEQVKLVDVRMLRSKALGLQAGDGVDEMMENLRRHERETAMAKTRSQMSGSSSMPQLRPLSAMTSSTSSCLDLSYEARLERVLARKQSGFVDNILRKLGTMSGQTPYTLPYRFVLTDSADEPMLGLGSRVGTKEAEKPGKGALARTLVKRATLQNRNGKSAAVGPEFQRMVSEMCGSEGQTYMPQQPRAAVLNLDTQTCTQEELAALKARLKALQQWAHVRAAVKVIMLFFRKRRLAQSTEIIKAVLRQLGEWARIKSAMRRMMRSVSRLQQSYRAFLALKRKRCDSMQREWQRVEDHHLAVYFKLYSQKILVERADIMTGAHRKRGTIATQEVKEHQHIYKQLQETSSQNLLIDWRQYRIPVRERKIVIGKWYMMQLKKHVRLQQSLINAVMKAVDSERELMRFLRSFGAVDEIRVAEVSMPVEHESPPPFYTFTEDTLLKLIALSAQALADVDPFQEHPANKDLPPNTRGPSKEARNASKVRQAVSTVGNSFKTSAGAEEDALLSDSMLNDSLDMTRMDGPGLTLGRLRKRPDQNGNQSREEEVAAVGVSEKAKMNIEDVFKQFTPRLREIVEAQAMEQREEMAKNPEDEHCPRSPAEAVAMMIG